MTTVAWALGLRRLQVPGEVITVCGRPYDHARNTACQICLDRGFEWLFFLDSDVVPPPDVINRLQKHGQPIMSGMYSRRSTPHAIPVMLRGSQWVTNYPKGEVIDVDLVGAGCLLIHHSVLKKLPPQKPGRHWFNWQVDMTSVVPAGEALSEDFTFCLHARRHGYKIKVDTSIECDHLGVFAVRHNQANPVSA